MGQVGDCCGALSPMRGTECDWSSCTSELLGSSISPENALRRELKLTQYSFPAVHTHINKGHSSRCDKTFVE
jgi:hypothetical protein